MPGAGYMVSSATQLGGHQINRRGNKLVENIDSSSQPSGLPSRTDSMSSMDSHLSGHASQVQSALSTGHSEKSFAQRSLRPQPLYHVNMLPRDGKLYITSAHLESAMAALARTPMIKSSLRGEHLNYYATIDELKSLALYSTPNKPVQEQQADLAALTLHPITGVQGGVAVFDAQTQDQPILYTSAIQSATSLKSGASTRICFPEGLASVAKLSVNQGGSCKITKEGCFSITMQVVSSGIGRERGERECYISNEKDVTKAFRSATVAEICRIYGISKDNLCIDAGRASFCSDDDSLALTEQFLAECRSADAVDTATKVFRLMDARTCAMESLTLMTELATFRGSQQDIMIVDLTEINPVDGGIIPDVPYVSQALFGDLHGNVKRAWRFMQAVVDSVYACKDHNEPVKLADGAFSCVPLFFDTKKRVDRWAVFINPLAKPSLFKHGRL